MKTPINSAFFRYEPDAPGGARFLLHKLQRDIRAFYSDFVPEPPSARLAELAERLDRAAAETRYVNAADTAVGGASVR